MKSLPKRKRREVVYKKVYYERNVELGIDPYCHECVSHSVDDSGYIACVRDGFYRMHRWIYWCATKEKPEVVMHLCDNRRCISLRHLRAGTVADNNRDMSDKGRDFHPGAPKGNKWNRKLTPVQIRMIRYYYAKGMTNKQIAQRFDVTDRTISGITSSENYMDVK
jgi:hypothetical protein